MSVKYIYSFGKTGLNSFNANNVLLLPNIYVTLTKHSESLLNRLRSKSLSSKLSFKRMHREWLKHLIFCNWKFCSILENLFQLLRNLWLHKHSFIWILTFILFCIDWNNCTFLVGYFSHELLHFFTFKDLCFQKKHPDRKLQ